MDSSDFVQLLKNNPVFWSRLGFCYDPPLPDEQGKPLVFDRDLSRYGAEHRRFQAAGVKIHTCILHSGWVGVDTYDYSLTDQVLEEVFGEDPDVYFIPRVKLNVPIDWCYQNPEDVFVYHGGPATAEGIRRLVGTLQQDYIGYEAPNGYYTANSPFVDPRPNVGGLIARQSFSSQKWLEDATAALNKLMDRLEKSPYADRIIGYHIAYGASGESVLWGRASGRYGDYGIGHRRAFYRWGLKKYGSPAALADAWMQPEVTEDTLQLPSPQMRYGTVDSCVAFFRGDAAQQICTDFDEFISEINADAIIHFAKTVKQRNPKLLTGVFYGYFLCVDNAAYTGHLAMDTLLDSPYVDFFAAPKSYYRNSGGEPGGLLCPAQSVNHKKLWVDELDNRTYLAQSVEQKSWISDGFTDTQAVMWREFSKNLAADSGFWWMDLGGGWFDADDIMQEIQSMVKANDRLRQLPHQSQSDILVLVDEDSISRMHISKDLRAGFLQDFLCELHLTGCLSDLYRLKDLAWLDVSRYKLIIFAYTFCLDETQRQQIASLGKDKVLLFHYAAGIRSETGCSLDNVHRLTGLQVQPAPSGELDFPQLSICPVSGAKPLLTDDQGNWKVAQITDETGVRILNTQPYLQRTTVRAIAEQAGCHLYTDADHVVYGDNRFLGVFNREAGPVTIRMREKGTYQNLLTGEVFPDTDTLTITLPDRSGAVLTATGATDTDISR